MEEEDVNWERAHLRVEGNGVEERDTDWERAHLIRRDVLGGRCRLGESALDRARGVEEVTDWERAHLVGWEWCGGGKNRLGESALKGGKEWETKMPTGRERT